jgi:hypothetical protein
MVHALRRVHGMMTPSGVVIDIHPSADAAVILVGDTGAGVVVSEAGSVRHQAATDALAIAANERLYRREDSIEFDFFTYADSIEELRDFILANWRDTAIADDVIDRARALAGSRGQPRAGERVSMSLLRPI